MSNNTIISIAKYEVENFFSIDHGSKTVTLIFFQGNNQGSAPTIIELPPDKAEALGKELIARAEKVRKNQ